MIEQEILSVAEESKASPKNPTYAYVGAFIDELWRSGVEHAVVCPGSRSTPLAMALSTRSELHTWMHVDERSAAFFALGMAKRLQKTVALVCTSGTAAANFLPAVVEAHLSHIPLLVLTADRPHELRDNGAPQSIDQNRLYGTYAKWFVEMALPEASNASLRYVRTLANRAVYQAETLPVGPVHLNFPFREPLTPEALPDQPLPPIHQRDETAWMGRLDAQPYISVSDSGLTVPTTEVIAELTHLMRTARQGLIVIGPNNSPQLTQEVLHLSEQLGYPILADALSQLRSGPHDHANIITSYDAFLRNQHFVENVRPELVLRFGAMPTSKPLLLYMKWYDNCPQVVIDEQNVWQEPTQLASVFVHAQAAALCRELVNALKQAPNRQGTDTTQEWLHLWQQTDKRTRQTLQTTLRDFPEPFEGRVFSELTTLLPEESILYAGNSMPVRDMDTFFWGNTRHISVMSNRGANGIDGVVSSALGASAANGEPTVLVIGDLSFYHDLNGLLAARLHQLNLVIVLVNNDGGGIFSFLPQAQYPEHFEQLFGTPTGLDFRPVVQMYGGTFQTVTNWEQFRREVASSLKNGGLHVVEVKTERESNVTMHRQLWKTLDIL